MWVLLIVLLSGPHLTSEQMFFGDLESCQKAQAQVEGFYRGWKPKAYCLCVEVDQ